MRTKVVTILAAALVAFSAAGAPAIDATENEPPPEDSDDAGWAEHVSQAAADWGTTPEDAEARLRRQNAVLDLADFLNETLPLVFGSLWVDHAGGGKVKVGLTINDPLVVEAVRNHFPDPEALEIQQVPYSRSELIAVMDDLWDNRDQ